MFRVVGMAGVIILVFAFFAQQSTPLEAGTPAPALRARLLDGRVADLKLQGGKITIINVWATWCPPCLQEIPDLVSAHAHFQQNPKTGCVWWALPRRVQRLT